MKIFGALISMNIACAYDASFEGCAVFFPWSKS
jgi:hypothetical protein